ncbi:MAG: S1 family peptidase [Terriglobales bacterium]
MTARTKLAATARAFLCGALLALILAALVAISRIPATTRQNARMTEMVTQLTAEVSRLSQEQAMPSVVVARHRDSICYVYALYSLTPGGRGRRFYRPVRTRVSGTGFVVADGLIATNRHVVEPWFEDEEDQAQIRLGAVPKIEKLMAFFPGHSNPVELTDVTVSRGHDLAVARFSSPPEEASPRPVPLAANGAVPGDAVVVVGYPMGVTAMLAKSPRKVYKRLAYSRETIEIARDLAQHYLIRPSATYGHLGDVVEDKLIYDAPTAQGGSGGPVFNSEGQVIGVNAAYIDGFAGGTLGISVEALKPLIAEAQKPLLKTKPARAEVASDESSATDFSVPAVSDNLR